MLGLVLGEVEEVWWKLGKVEISQGRAGTSMSHVEHTPLTALHALTTSFLKELIQYGRTVSWLVLCQFGPG